MSHGLLGELDRALAVLDVMLLAVFIVWERLLDRFWRWRHRWPRERARPWERDARRLGLFGAYADWVGAFAVDAQGEVWFCEDAFDWSRKERVTELSLRFVALSAACRRHPELRGVTPQRGTEDPVCRSCLGRGYQASLPPRLRYWILCECGGAGWLPEAVARIPRGADGSFAAR